MKQIFRNPVLGAICGDMIGVPYEWYSKNHLTVPKDFKLWSSESKFSDDTVMTLAVADWLLKGTYSSTDLIDSIQKFGRKYPRAGYGGLFRNWLKEDHPKPYGSYGNGSAMRVSPVGCWFLSSEAVLEKAKDSALVSHNHPEGIKGAQVVAEAIHILLNSSPEDYSLSELTGYLISLSEGSYNFRTPTKIKESGYKFDSTCQGSVPEAISCFLYSNSYEETVRNAVWLCGDADTQACIAGSLAAAYWGIPREIVLEGLDRLPDDLYKVLEEFSIETDLDII